MESHWPHRTPKRSLFLLAVSNVMVSLCLYMHWYFLIFLISWLFQMCSHWPHWTTKRSLCALAVSNWGGGTWPVSFSSYDCFKWVLIDGMDMHRVRSFSLAVSFEGQTSPVTFSSNDCFEWVLIDGMETHSCHFFVKQFQMGGGEGRTLAKVGSSSRFELPEI